MPQTKLTPNQVRGFRAAWAGWTLDGAACMHTGYFFRTSLAGS